MAVLITSFLQLNHLVRRSAIVCLAFWIYVTAVCKNDGSKAIAWNHYIVTDLEIFDAILPYLLVFHLMAPAKYKSNEYVGTTDDEGSSSEDSVQDHAQIDGDNSSQAASEKSR